MQGRGDPCRRSGPSLTPISACMHLWHPYEPNPSLTLTQGCRVVDPLEHPSKLLHCHRAGPPPGHQIGRAAPLWARRRAPRCPVASSSTGKPSRWAPARSWPDLGFPSCLPGPEVGDDGQPSISTRFDGPGRPIPIRPPLPPMTGPRRSGDLNRHTARAAPGVGRPSMDPPRTARYRPVFIFFSKILLLIRFFLLDSKIHQIFSEYANSVIQISVDSLFSYLSNSSACIFYRPL
jgi:hypothetical protein